MTLPSPKLESWRYTDVRGIELDRFEEAKQDIEFIGQAGSIVFTNISAAKKSHKELLDLHPLNSLVKEFDIFNEMHKKNAKDGIFIYVPDNTIAELPLKNIIKTKQAGSLFTHTLIIIGRNSRLAYVEEHLSDGFEGEALRVDAVEIHVGENSSVDFYNLQAWQGNVLNITEWKARLSRDSRLNWHFGQFGGRLSRIRIDTFLEGQGSESLQKGVFYGDKKQHFDITTNINHLVPNTSGNILVKGVLDGNATSVYRGKIKISKIAQNTNSYLSDHSLILSENARSNSIPSLEIDANEVKASHGATLGKPDEEELFYLKSRGLKNKQAERLIILGFFSPVTEHLLPELQSRFEDALRSKTG